MSSWCRVPKNPWPSAIWVKVLLFWTMQILVALVPSCININLWWVNLMLNSVQGSQLKMRWIRLINWSEMSRCQKNPSWMEPSLKQFCVKAPPLKGRRSKLVLKGWLWAATSVVTLWPSPLVPPSHKVVTQKLPKLGYPQLLVLKHVIAVHDASVS